MESGQPRFNILEDDNGSVCWIVNRSAVLRLHEDFSEPRIGNRYLPYVVRKPKLFKDPLRLFSRPFLPFWIQMIPIPDLRELPDPGDRLHVTLGNAVLPGPRIDISFAFE